MKKKIFTLLLVLMILSTSLFAKTTVIHTSRYGDGANPLFNDIYSSLMFNTTVTENYDTTSSDDYLLLYGANLNGSVFFMDFPVGVNYSIDLMPVENEVFMVDGLVGFAIRTNTDSLRETFINFGPAFSIVAQSNSVVSPFALVYWGAGLNTGVRVASNRSKNFTMDIGLSAKALWYDALSIENVSSFSLTSSPKDFRTSFSGYVGFTYRWFAPDWSDKDLNVIVAL